MSIVSAWISPCKRASLPRGCSRPIPEIPAALLLRGASVGSLNHRSSIPPLALTLAQRKRGRHACAHEAVIAAVHFAAGATPASRANQKAR
jgi:hypothetical protein